MTTFTMIGSKIMLAISVLLALVALWLPFLEGFALSPLIAFVHRFSITLEWGSFSKTIQPLLFVIPILFFKAVYEYHKRYGLVQLIKSPLAVILALLLVADLLSLATTTSQSLSVSTFVVHLANIAIFITSSIWLRIIGDSLTKENQRKIAVKLVKTFALSLIIFSVINAVFSVSQFLDCSGKAQVCSVWAGIDNQFPNKLLPVGHQKFSESPVVIRAIGLFGDVNFNGMVSLLLLAISITVLIVSELLKREKGYVPTKEQQYLWIPIIASVVSYTLTLSRSAVIGFLGIAILILCTALLPLIRVNPLQKQFTKTILQWTGIALIAGCFLFGVGFLVPISHDGERSSISSEILRYTKTILTPSEDASANGHAWLFKTALIIGNQRPLWGMGMGTFSEQYSLVIEKGNTTSNPHSTYGMLYSEQGIIGVILYSSVIIYLWILSGKQIFVSVNTMKEYLQSTKRPEREFFITHSASLFISLISVGIPFFSLATATYYGFFLPMTWWWGNKLIVTPKQQLIN